VDVCCRCVAPQGLASAWALVRLLSSLLFGVEVHDPVVFLTAPLVLMAVALAAAHGPDGL
jgi:hypothetical protein